MTVSYSVWAAVTEYQRLGGLNIHNLFIIILWVRKSKIKVLRDLVPGENTLHGLYTVISSLCPHMGKRDDLSHVSS